MSTIQELKAMIRNGAHLDDVVEIIEELDDDDIDMSAALTVAQNMSRTPRGKNDKNLKQIIRVLKSYVEDDD